jgi:hypothetical protein
MQSLGPAEITLSSVAYQLSRLLPPPRFKLQHGITKYHWQRFIRTLNYTSPIVKRAFHTAKRYVSIQRGSI